MAVLLIAGWFVFGGVHAFVIGGCSTPGSGPFEGQYGLRVILIQAVGINPASREMTAFFVVYGLAWLVLVLLYFIKLPLAHRLMLVTAIGALWYLAFGTLLCLLQIVLLLAPKKIAKA